MLNDGYILTAAEMQQAENDLIAAGTSIEELMRRAGTGAAQYIWRVRAEMPTLVLCGPGNNGGDGYVIAQWLLEKDVDVIVAANGEPTTDVARDAKARWHGETIPIENAKPRAQFVDCLFGTGLSRPVAGDLLDNLERLAKGARRRVAIDLPSGVDTDNGQLLNTIPGYDLAIALGGYKPAHFLGDARSKLGNLVGVEIGISALSGAKLQKRPAITIPQPDAHKYSRGMVAVIAGKIPGAANLTALAAQHAGAGYVKLFSRTGTTSNAGNLVQQIFDDERDLQEKLTDPRIDIVVLGPGLGLGDQAQSSVESLIAMDKPLLLDADALTLLGDEAAKILSRRKAATILTPHPGEFTRIYESFSESKLEQARGLAKESNAVVLYKGPDTVVAEPGGEAALFGEASPWLSTAGSGDILAAVIASRFAVQQDAFTSATHGQWLHTRAAQLAGPAFTPDMLIDQIPTALAECL